MVFASSFSPQQQSPQDYIVPQAGGDGISSLTWSPTSNILTSTNWDGGIRCWEVQEQNGQVQAIPKAQGMSIIINTVTIMITFCLYLTYL